MTLILHYGLVRAVIDDDAKTIRLKLKRYGKNSTQLGDSAIKSMYAWANDRLSGEYPNYTVTGDE